MKRREFRRLRLAMLSPAFRDKVQQLAVIQIVASGEESEAVPIDDDGRVMVAQIDWDAIADFIERLIPLIMQLINIFSGVAANTSYDFVFAL